MTAPLNWIRRLTAALPELNAIPLFGNAPSLDWGTLSSLLSSRFGLSCHIHPREQMWRQGAQIHQGIGSSLSTLPFSITPIGSVYWLMSEEDRSKLLAALLHAKSRPSFSEIFQEGLYPFVALEILDALSTLSPFSQLTLQMEGEPLSDPKAFCIDLEMTLNGKSVWGRLIVPETFRSKWVQHFAHLPTEFSPLAKSTPLTLSLKTGSVILDQTEWEQANPGDFIALDQGYDPHKHTGPCLLMLQATPLFNVKIKSGKVELIDYAFYYEETMTKQGPMPPVAPEGELTALKQAPIYITVEIGRLQMTLEQLMKISPGNTLDLPIHPEQGVLLTVNGQPIGRAELLHLGEQLGLRILEIAST